MGQENSERILGGFSYSLCNFSIFNISFVSSVMNKSTLKWNESEHLPCGEEGKVVGNIACQRRELSGTNSEYRKIHHSGPPKKENKKTRGCQTKLGHDCSFATKGLWCSPFDKEIIRSIIHTETLWKVERINNYKVGCSRQTSCMVTLSLMNLFETYFYILIRTLNNTLITYFRSIKL